MKKKIPPKRLTSVDTEIGQRIRAARLSAGMSQTDLGTRLGVTFQQVQKYEKGVNRLSGSRMVQMIDTLKLPGDYFVAGISKPGAVNSSGTTMLSDKFGNEIARIWESITPGGRQALRDMAQHLATHKT